MRCVRLGCGAGYSGDRLEPAVELAERGDLDYLVFECLAERRLALANLAKLQEPTKWYAPGLEARMRAVLQPCRRRGTRIITNMGAANPTEAGCILRRIASDLRLRGLRVAVILGDDILARARSREVPLLPPGCLEGLGDAL